MYVKLFTSILDSSVWLEDMPTRLLWITMLAMADEDGLVGASVGGLAKRAGISREECEAGLAKFLAADPDSRNEMYEGRRIEKATGGWLLLNHKLYREIRTKHQRAEAERQSRHRARVRGVTESDSHEPSRLSHAITPTASASASVSEVAVEQQTAAREETAEPVSRDPIDEVIAESRLDVRVFSDTDRAIVTGFLRSQRSPLAVAQVLAAHMVDEEVAPKVLALAVREYAALADERGFRARHFAGFVKRAKGHVEQAPGRVQARQEERFITSEDNEAERAKREEAEMIALIDDFARTHGEEYETLLLRAEREIPASFKGTFRAPAVRGILARLIRERKKP